ncbi:MAG TPA: LLM class flavin-dependent oxidoreductase [Ilumatobacteraceae bacterium]|nr:LLM class flavin-dependent oxidoreductase [Ilumatobacteraceae bacterium]
MPNPSLPRHVHLAVSLDGAGYHPAAWRDPSSRPAELFTAGYWVDQVRRAEQGLLDFVSFDDEFGIQSGRRREVDTHTDQVRGRLDAVLVASRVAPATEHIGLLPVATTTYPEPFHIASAVSTLDWVSKGRAGWQPRVSGRPSDADLVGVRPAPDPDTGLRDLFDEAADAVEVVRRLWDSWEDDAIIKDVATGRFVDRDKLHYIDFAGRFFSVKGPSIVPRPPQGQPIVAVLAHQPIPFEFAARCGDVVFVTPAGTDDVGRWIADVRGAEVAVGRSGAPLRLFADLVVYLGDSAGAAADRKAELDQMAGFEHRSDAMSFTGTADELADLVVAWHDLGVEGFRLRPAVNGRDLGAIVDDVVPRLQRREVFRRAYERETLRARLGLARPVSRYARSA